MNQIKTSFQRSHQKFTGLKQRYQKKKIQRNEEQKFVIILVPFCIVVYAFEFEGLFLSFGYRYR